jgi:ABC-2 type transport system permease protein
MPEPTDAALASEARRPLSVGGQFLDLVLIQLTNWRRTWPGMITIGMVTPLLGLLALGAFARDRGADMLGYVLVGNIILALLFQNQNNVSNNFSLMRTTGALDFFASLPIRRGLLVLATVSAFLLLSLPALTVTAVAGSLLLDLRLAPSPWLLVALPLAVLPAAAIGALVGLLTRAEGQNRPVSLALTALMIGLGPVVVPPSLLPGWLLTASWVNPAVWASSALRQCLLGPVTARLAVDLGLLAGTAVLLFWLVRRVMRSRAE